MPDIYLLLGSNLGNRENHLFDAVAMIGSELGEVHCQSSYYETQAWGKTDQPNFINQALKVSVEMSAEDLLSNILRIESVLGRVRDERWGSRIIDIDILFYGLEIINQPHLIIPHKLLHERRFVLMPLAEIASDFIHPGLNKTVKELLFELTDPLSVKK